jgi:hypothetical protein
MATVSEKSGFFIVGLNIFPFFLFPHFHQTMADRGIRPLECQIDMSFSSATASITQHLQIVWLQSVFGWRWQVLIFAHQACASSATRERGVSNSDS